VCEGEQGLQKTRLVKYQPVARRHLSREKVMPAHNAGRRRPSARAYHRFCSARRPVLEPPAGLRFTSASLHTSVAQASRLLFQRRFRPRPRALLSPRRRQTALNHVPAEKPRFVPCRAPQRAKHGRRSRVNRPRAEFPELRVCRAFSQGNAVIIHARE